MAKYFIYFHICNKLNCNVLIIKKKFSFIFNKKWETTEAISQKTYEH